jgi:RNA-directed DNA polymerase
MAGLGESPGLEPFESSSKFFHSPALRKSAFIAGKWTNHAIARSRGVKVMLGPSLHTLKSEARKRGYQSEYTDRLLAVANTLQGAKVPTVFTLMHLARLSCISWSYLRSVVERKVDDYRVFTIKKRQGGNRRICSPSPALRRVQTWVHRNILCAPGSLAKVHEASTAYAPGSSIRANAKLHSGAVWMVKIDIKDFFESISERQVYYAFRRLGYPALLSFELARLCTRIVPPRDDGVRRKRESMWRWNNDHSKLGKPYGTVHSVGHLPQGAPTSAMLANLVFADLDVKIQSIAQSQGATYTRYADDIALTMGISSRAKCEIIFRDVARQISLAGYRVNRIKSGVTPPGSRKIVTGLVINDSVPRLPREVKEDIMLCLYHIKKHGLLSHMERRHAASPLGYLNHLMGRILYAHSIEREFGAAAMKWLREIMAPYRELLDMARTLSPTIASADGFTDLHSLIFHENKG